MDAMTTKNNADKISSREDPECAEARAVLEEAGWDEAGVLAAEETGAVAEGATDEEPSSVEAAAGGVVGAILGTPGIDGITPVGTASKRLVLINAVAAAVLSPWPLPLHWPTPLHWPLPLPFCLF